MPPDQAPPPTRTFRWRAKVTMDLSTQKFVRNERTVAGFQVKDGQSSNCKGDEFASHWSRIDTDLPNAETRLPDQEGRTRRPPDTAMRAVLCSPRVLISEQHVLLLASSDDSGTVPPN